VVLASAGVVAGISAASAGAPALTNRLTILKTVSGEVPEGTTFTVTVECDHDVIDDGEGGTDTATATFDAEGQPTNAAADQIDLLSTIGTCTVTETEDGGATSTTYECEGGPTVSATAVALVCPEPGPVEESITVNKSYPAIDATVTVDNTFPEPATTTTTTAPPPQQPAASPAIVARPVFTG
jgi:hypothetical protein